MGLGADSKRHGPSYQREEAWIKDMETGCASLAVLAGAHSFRLAGVEPPDRNRKSGPDNTSGIRAIGDYSRPSADHLLCFFLSSLSGCFRVR